MFERKRKRNGFQSTISGAGRTGFGERDDPRVVGTQSKVSVDGPVALERPRHEEAQRLRAHETVDEFRENDAQSAAGVVFVEPLERERRPFVRRHLLRKYSTICLCNISATDLLCGVT